MHQLLLVWSYTVVVDRETCEGVGCVLSLILATRRPLRIASFFLDNHLVLLSVLLLLNVVSSTARVVVVLIAAIASNLLLALVRVELGAYQSAAT